jgi:hypothetical protein
MRLIDADALMCDMGCVGAVKYGNKTAEQQHNSYSTLMLYEIADYIEDAPTIDAVSPGVLEQYKWERDTAIAQLEELGIGFGQKKPDMVEVVRCKDCKHWIVDEYWNGNPDQVRACRFAGWMCGANGYCLYGERKMDAEV